MKMYKVVPLVSLLLLMVFIISSHPPQVAANLIDESDAPAAQPQPTPDWSRVAKPPLVGGGPVQTPLIFTDDSQNPRLNNPEPSLVGPTINVWYGTDQKFGHLGDPQKWVNILGNVSTASAVTSLTYAVNGNNPSPLTVGPDGLRLADQGDFIIEIDYTDLVIGNNVVVIMASDASGQSQKTVNVNYQPHNGPWDNPYVIDWTTSPNIQDHVQVVDGQWAVDDFWGSLHPLTFDYDRLVAIGDMSWSDYEITVPVTVYGIDDSGFEGVSSGPGIGILTRWTGHFDVGAQPRTGWQNLGALGWFRWSTPETSGAELRGYGGEWIQTDPEKQLVFEQPYYFKMKVQSNPGLTATHSFKMWPLDEAEPAGWDLQGLGFSGEPQSGSILLVAHHVDVVFGDVTVNINSTKPQPQLSLSTVGEGQIQVSPQAAGGVYRFAEDVELTAVAAEGYEFAGWVGDLGGSVNPATITMFGDREITAVFVSPNQVLPKTDKFNRCELGSDWNFVNPLGDGSYTMTGYQAAITVPTGPAHDIWVGGNNSARLMQPAQDVDFEIETKIDSSVDVNAQLQGLLVEKDTVNFLRFDVFRDQDGTHLFAASFNFNTPTAQGNILIDDITDSIYLRVKREGDTWTQTYSYDGETWLPGNTFDYALPVTAVGIFAGNAGANPAHTAAFDYFLNDADPIDLTDDPITLTTEIVGEGSVAANPDLPAYTCGQTVTLTATPAAEWLFNNWGGAASGTNPVTTVDTDTFETIVRANFRPEVSPDYTLDVNIISNGSGVGGTVTQAPDQEFYQWGDEVLLTAVPNSGWTFDGWSGGIISTTNPIPLTIMQNEVVSATFSQQLYTIDVSVSAGNGDYTLVPDKELYELGEMVTLTANPDAGWTFAGWDGDVPNGTNGNNPLTFEVTQDHEISVLFTEEPYLLTVTWNTEGGTVTKDPAQAVYYYGDVVELTAVPNDGWFFFEWSGDVSGTNPVTEITIQGDQNVVATFRNQNEAYKLALPIIRH